MNYELSFTPLQPILYKSSSIKKNNVLQASYTYERISLTARVPSIYTSTEILVAVRLDGDGLLDLSVDLVKVLACIFMSGYPYQLGHSTILVDVHEYSLFSF